MDIVFIEQLTAMTTIGVYDWEQTIKQKLVIDLEMAWDNKKAAVSDNVEYCLNYATVSQLILDFLEKKHFLLIERVAEELAGIIMSTFGVSWIRIKVRKPAAVPQAFCVGVVIERGQYNSQ